MWGIFRSTNSSIFSAKWPPAKTRPWGWGWEGSASWRLCWLDRDSPSVRIQAVYVDHLFQLTHLQLQLEHLWSGREDLVEQRQGSDCAARANVHERCWHECRRRLDRHLCAGDWSRRRWRAGLTQLGHTAPHIYLGCAPPPPRPQ